MKNKVCIMPITIRTANTVLNRHISMQKARPRLYVYIAYIQ